MTDETTPIKEPPSPEQPVVPPTEASSQPPKKPIHKKWWFWVIIVVLAIGVLGNLGDGDNDVAETPVEEPAVTEPASDPEPEPEPAPEPEPEPEPTIQEVADGVYGAFDAFTEEGSGDGTVDLPEGVMMALVTASHSGGSNFSVHTIDSNNENLDLLVNEIGNYQGTTLYDDGRGQPVRLRISANGGWAVTVSPVSSAEVIGDADSGTGDAVLLYDGDAADFVISHDGSSNFVVLMHGNGQGLIVNEIGSYQGTIPVRGGPAVLEINADGNWTIEVQ